MKSATLLSILAISLMFSSFSCASYQNKNVWGKVADKTLEKTVIIEVLNEILELEGMGSGVVISEDGWILTNRHVVVDYDGEVAPFLMIRFPDNRIKLAEKVVVSQTVDLALVKISATDLEFIKIREKEVVVGEPCLALGSPFPYQFLIIDGIVSHTDFKHFFGPEAEEDAHSFFVHSATLHGGNSGGALIDSKGRLLGINTAGYNPPGPFSYGLSIKSSYILGFINFVDPKILD